jgi:hypothetical protein
MKFNKMSFDMTCNHNGVKTPSVYKDCKPYFGNHVSGPDVTVTPSSLLFSFLNPNSRGDELALKIMKLLGGVMLNGIPVLSLDDFIFMSDFLNENIDSSMKRRITESPIIDGMFGNILGVRMKQIRLSPDNCWTRGFLTYLHNTSESSKVK